MLDPHLNSNNNVFVGGQPIAPSSAQQQPSHHQPLHYYNSSTAPPHAAPPAVFHQYPFPQSGLSAATSSLPVTGAPHNLPQPQPQQFPQPLPQSSQWIHHGSQPPLLVQQPEQRYVARQGQDGALQFVAVFDAAADPPARQNNMPNYHSQLYSSSSQQQMQQPSSWPPAAAPAVSPTTYVFPPNGMVSNQLQTQSQQQYPQAHPPQHTAILLHHKYGNEPQPFVTSQFSSHLTQQPQLAYAYQQSYQQQPPPQQTTTAPPQVMQRAPSGPFEVAPPPPPMPQNFSHSFAASAGYSNPSTPLSALGAKPPSVTANNTSTNATKPVNGVGLEEGKLYHGVVKRYNPTRGFGFLRTDDGVDVFVHQSCVNMCGFRALNVGARVVFTAGVVMGTLQAMDVNQETPYLPGGSATTLEQTQQQLPQQLPQQKLLPAPPASLGITPSAFGGNGLLFPKEFESLSLSGSERGRMLVGFHPDDSKNGNIAAVRGAATPANALPLPLFGQSGLPTELRLPNLAVPPMDQSQHYQGIPMFSSPTVDQPASPVPATRAAASSLFASGLISTHSLPTSLTLGNKVGQLFGDEATDSINPLDHTFSSFAPSMMLSTASSGLSNLAPSRVMSVAGKETFLVQVGTTGAPAATTTTL